MPCPWVSSGIERDTELRAGGAGHNRGALGYIELGALEIILDHFLQVFNFVWIYRVMHHEMGRASRHRGAA